MPISTAIACNNSPYYTRNVYLERIPWVGTGMRREGTAQVEATVTTTLGSASASRGSTVLRATSSQSLTKN